MSRSLLATREPPAAAHLSSTVGQLRSVVRPPGHATILLVDDDSAVRESLHRVLALEGWQVVSAASGEEALEHLATHQPDLLITDLCMAEVSGWDLLFHENLHRPALPIFVITALPVPAARDADHFASEFFQKPLDLEALVAAIHRRLRRAPAPATPPPNPAVAQPFP